MIIQPGLVYLTRDDWKADKTIPRLGRTVARSSRTEAIIHHTVIVDSDTTKNLWTTIYEVKAKMRQLQKIRPDLGKDVPYNFVMFLMEDGSIIVCEGRGLDLSGAHTKGHNYDGVATALQGNFMLPVNLTPYVPAISRWWGHLKYDMGMANLGSRHPTRGIAYGHRDFRDPNDTSTWTSCPGDNLYAIIPLLTFQKETEAPPDPEPGPDPPEPSVEKEKEIMVIVIIKAENDTTQYILNTDGRKYRLGSSGHRGALNRLSDSGAIRIEYREIPAADMGAIPDEHV